MKTVVKTALWCFILTVNSVLALQTAESDKEKVLFSFEREEVEKIVQNKKDIAKFSNGGDFIFFSTRTYGLHTGESISRQVLVQSGGKGRIIQTEGK